MYNLKKNDKVITSVSTTQFIGHITKVEYETLASISPQRSISYAQKKKKKKQLWKSFGVHCRNFSNPVE